MGPYRCAVWSIEFQVRQKSWEGKMSLEYMIQCNKPKGYDSSLLLGKLPSPIAPGFREIYNYAVRSEGFYFVDQLVDPVTAAFAFKLFVDEALSISADVVIRTL
jgi:hypothetical protein